MTEDDLHEDDLHKDLIWALPHSERLALLICSIVEDRNAVAVCDLVKATSVIARHLAVTERFEVAELMRDVADDLEVLGHAKATT
jgi:uncharacterized tellurite resistance protein B-like protein